MKKYFNVAFLLPFYIITAELKHIALPVTFRNLTSYTIAGYEKECLKNPFILSPYGDGPEQDNEDDSQKNVIIQFKKKHTSLDGKNVYKAALLVQGMNLNPPFMHKGSMDEWVIYFKTHPKQPKNLVYTFYEQHTNRNCDIFIQSHLPGVHAYRDISFTKISSKL